MERIKVLLGITGSIAAYKSLKLVRMLKKNGAEVRVILTQSATHFVTPLSCQTLTEHEVYMDQFVLTRGIKHIALSDWADVLVVAPATANIIGKTASGVADDLLSTTLMSFAKPILFVPAMDLHMWQNTIVQGNASKLKKEGYFFLNPTQGVLASGKIGTGRFPPLPLILRKVISLCKGYKSLDGKKFLISGGRTEEDIDPVRTITNRSSGKMARELLYAVVCRDGEAKGVFGEVGVPLLDELDISRVRTSSEMLKELKKWFPCCDCLIMAAAIGDYKPKKKSQGKIHTSSLTVQLEKNIDLLTELRKIRKQQTMVGFSLDRNQQLKRGKEKLKKKGLDMIVLNEPGVLGKDRVKARIVKKSGRITKVGTMSKWQLANKILDHCLDAMSRKKQRKG